MIYRFSSRRNKLDEAFLNQKLQGALAYDRIAGYFSSSILEIAGEAIESVEGTVRMVCNSELDVEDVRTASAAVNAMRREWCGVHPEEKYQNAPERLRKLYDLIKCGKLSVRVVPNNVFGLIHGKAGVIKLNDGSKTAFMGSVNETYSAWRLNYEMLWEDDSPEAVAWVQDEFEYFWRSPHAVPLSEFVIEDMDRIAERKVIHSVAKWKREMDPASTIIEAPVYRKEYGLWEHQKFFVDLAFRDHKQPHGARYVLADMVGLGKTVQLALAAQLMALYGSKPVLIIVPRTLIWQWQDEMHNLLDMPSAVWTGKEWVDENGIRYPSGGDIAIKKCPRRVGVISQGLITANSGVVEHLLGMEYECIIVDEAHRARRKNLGVGKENEKPNPNNLMRFLLSMSGKTKSMLLATATPVQMYPVEAWDLLYILSQANDSVLGSHLSMWRKNPKRAMDLIMGKESLGRFSREAIDWIRNPFPPATEDERTFGRIRAKLGMPNDEFVISPSDIDSLSAPDQKQIGRIIDNDFMANNNPFIRHIVRRTRTFLENTINEETREPYLKAIEVRLFGESDEDAIELTPYLKDAYASAVQFCDLFQKRVRGGGFLKTLLLRRVGSSMEAGRSTALKMLGTWEDIFDEDGLEEEEVYDTESKTEVKTLTPKERDCLERFIATLEANKDNDPKYNHVLRLLVDENWIERGCIIFSQYYASAYWVAEMLSKDLPTHKIGLYAGGDKSGLIVDGVYERRSKEEIKAMVKHRELKVLVGTDAASEGLNLQTLGTLINLDLPWNPTRLEQRKGRIQRIGQAYDEIYVFNMRYKGSVEDRVHSLLSERLANIHGLFGQIPDVLEDVWVDVALNDIEEARKKIDAVPSQHPFELRYHEHVGKVDWEHCSMVLDRKEKKRHLREGW